MTALVHSSSVVGGIREAVKKHFLKNSVAGFLEAKQFVSAQLQWAYFLSLYRLHLDPWKRATIVVFRKSRCFGRSRSQAAFSQRNYKNPGMLSIGPQLTFPLLLDKNIWVRQTEHKLGQR